jgi:methylmalonyl-CoA/ethylmalonyl-CoA epimerase
MNQPTTSPSRADASGPFQVARIGQIAINVHDLDRAVAFYRDRLRLKFLFAAPGLAFFDCGGTRLMLARAEKPEFDHPTSIVYYQVDDLDAAHRTLVAAGVPFIEPPRLVHRGNGIVLRLAFLEDTEGNPVGLMHETREA